MNEMSAMCAADVQRELERLADPDKATQLARYFQAVPGGYGEGDRFRGVRVPELRKLARRFRALPLDEVTPLLTSPWHEDRMVALLVMALQFPRATEAHRERLFGTYMGHLRFVNNWDLVDTSAEHVVGAFLRDRDKAPLDALAGSQDVWERRVAVLATFGYIKAGAFDETLRLADRLLGDPHDLVHKAVGWMLREVGQRDRDRLEAFLRPRYARMPRTMLRYAIEQLPEERRQDYLKGRA